MLNGGFVWDVRHRRWEIDGMVGFKGSLKLDR
jgi:hypothetical protein